MEDVVVVVQDQLDMGDGMQCSDHPYTNNPGGICAFCLQDKLGKLVSSSFPPLRVSAASSSASPSFRSDLAAAAATCIAAAAPSSSSSTSLALSIKANAEKYHPTTTQEYCSSTRGASSSTMSFLLARKKKKVSANGEEMVFKRSKSTTTPRRTRQHFMDASDELSSPRKRNGFWSFLYHQHKASNKKLDSSKISSSSSFASATASTPAVKSNLGSSSLRNRTETTATEVEDDVGSVSPNSQATTGSSFERKVSRSRSVGCGSRSFSGDFFERISTGFGDCSTLRRVESQREGKKQHSSTERVRCGGLFSGFMMTSSSSSSSSSSYWVSSSANNEVDVNGGRKGVTSARNGRSSSSWGSWAFASPMRAFSKPSSSKDGKIRRANNNNASDKNTTPNLSAIPSLLSVR